MKNQDVVLRVERGRVDSEELAAVAAVLLARHRERGQASHKEPPTAVPRWWRRPETYEAPGSWR
jgi:hypothetical protein